MENSSPERLIISDIDGFLDFLKDARKKKGVTLKNLADYLGCTEGGVAHQLRGCRKINFYTMLKILNKLGYAFSLVELSKVDSQLDDNWDYENQCYKEDLENK